MHRSEEPLNDQPPVDPTIATYNLVAGQFARAHFDSNRLIGDLEQFARAISEQGPTERLRILDAGCGPGQASKWFHEHGFQTIGVDLSQGMLSEARRRVPEVEFRQADLRSLDFPDGYFDGIWASASLLHLPRPDVPAVLASFNRLLGHGYLWLSVKMGFGEELVASAYGSDQPRRFTYFQRSEIELLVERAGFDVHEVTEAPITAENAHPFVKVLAQTKLRSPLLGAIAAVFDAEGRVLVSERADGRGWNLPAGFVDADEAPDEAAVRETREETGLDVEVDRLLSIASAPRFYRGFGPPVFGRLVSHAFLCRPIGGELIATNEALQHGWFWPDALPSPMSSHRHVEVVQQAVALRAGQLPWPTIRHYGRRPGAR